MVKRHNFTGVLISEGNPSLTTPLFTRTDGQGRPKGAASEHGATISDGEAPGLRGRGSAQGSSGSREQAEDGALTRGRGKHDGDKAMADSQAKPKITSNCVLISCPSPAGPEMTRPSSILLQTRSPPKKTEIILSPLPPQDRDARPISTASLSLGTIAFHDRICREREKEKKKKRRGYIRARKLRNRGPDDMICDRQTRIPVKIRRRPDADDA